MKSTKRLVILLLAVLMIVLFWSSTVAETHNLSPDNAPTAQPIATDLTAPISFTPVNLVHCLSSRTQFPTSTTDKPFLFCGNGWILSTLPGVTLISESTASFLPGFNSEANSNPDTIDLVFGSIVSTYSGNIPTFESSVSFYPFRELAKNLGYDILWRSINDCTYAFFTEHVDGGAWIHVSLEKMSKYVDTTDITPGNTGWLYSYAKAATGEYLVQYGPNKSFAVISDWITDIIPSEQVEKF